MWGGPARRAHIRFQGRRGKGSVKRSDQDQARAARGWSEKPISRRVYLCGGLCSISHSAKPSRP